VTDVHTPEQRRRNMASIKSEHTKPEMRVRAIVRHMGFRFSLHASDLPGKPDLVFPKLRKIIFVHGCFWHMHRCRYGKVVPATNTEFWQAKRLSNVKRDRKTLRNLRAAGWDVLVVWECKVKKHECGDRELSRFFARPSHAVPATRATVKKGTPKRGQHGKVSRWQS
jgi:DNA mismatch endonuclease, patch repair protein